MATEVKVPALGESITSGILAAWHVQDGDNVDKNQALYELETDKVTSEGNAEVAGQINLKVGEGDEVEVGQVIAVIDESVAKKSTGGNGKSPAKEETKDQAPDNTSEPASEEAASENGEPSSAPQSPAVRKLAEESGIDPASVRGSGKGGRVTKGDMLSEMERRDPSSQPADTPSSPTLPPFAVGSRQAQAQESQPQPVQEGRQTRKRMTPLRKRIAERLVAAKNQTAMLTTFNEVDMSAVMGLRKQHQEAFTKRHGVKLGFMSFFVKASVQALKLVPEANAQIEGDELIQNHYFDVGVAVSTDRGLLVPVLRDCDQIGFAEIEQKLGEYAGKAREGKIGIDDLQGGVFTITNGGIFGSLLSTPILNPPQAAILGMHAIKERPVVLDGEIVARPMMYLALTYDHRVIDGREAVTFLVKVKEAIEDPHRLLFEI